MQPVVDPLMRAQARLRLHMCVWVLGIYVCHLVCGLYFLHVYIYFVCMYVGGWVDGGMGAYCVSVVDPLVRAQAGLL